MTMKELAKLANVSASTVSKAFRNASDVSPETKELIFSLATEHGCFNKFSKNKYSKPTVAIICPEIKSPYYANYVERFQDIINKNGGIALVSADGFDPEKQAELIEYYAGYLKVDGIFVFNMNAGVKKGYTDTPIVAIFSSKHIEVDSVRIEFEAPIYDAIEHLYKTGHKNIAFIGENLTLYKSQKFEKLARKFPIQSTVIVSDNRYEKAGEDGVERLLELDDIPNGIICAYDDIAFGAIMALKSKGYKIPEDFSVIGIDNINTAALVETPLSTIDTRPDEICMIAWDLFTKKRKNKYFKLNQQIVLTGKLVLRETTRTKEGV